MAMPLFVFSLVVIEIEKPSDNQTWLAGKPPQAYKLMYKWENQL